MKGDIRNKNSHGLWHGYNQRYRRYDEILSTRANWKNDKIIGYHERHTPRFQQTNFYII